MIVLLAFWVFFTITIVLSWRAAVTAERQIIFVIVAATVGTFAVNSVLCVSQAMPWVLLIDLALFSYVLYRALDTSSFWPLWFAGLQGTALLVSVSGLIFGSLNLYYFQTLAGFWALPALLILVLGTRWDRRSAGQNDLDAKTLR